MTTLPSITSVVADIGGTNTRVALADGVVVRPDSVRRYRNAEQTGIIEVLTHYLDDLGVQVDAACVAMAGPVLEGVGRLTNLDWLVDRNQIAEAIGVATVAVLNDLQAQGHALNALPPEGIETVRAGLPGSNHAARLVVGVGTGLNAALVYRTDTETLVPPSESGHVNLPIQTARDLALFDFLAKTHGTPGAEEALSGRGIANVYAFVCDEAGQPVDHLTAAEVMQAVAANEPLARSALELFVTLLGRMVGTLALVQLPFGGIYFCGGVARAVAPYFGEMGFEAAFLDKGRFAEFLDQFPIRLVTDDYAALTGSAAHLMDRLAHEAMLRTP